MIGLSTPVFRGNLSCWQQHNLQIVQSSIRRNSRQINGLRVVQGGLPPWPRKMPRFVGVYDHTRLHIYETFEWNIVTGARNLGSKKIVLEGDFEIRTPLPLRTLHSGITTPGSMITPSPMVQFLPITTFSEI